MADTNGSANVFTLADGREVTLDMSRVKAKHVKRWAQYAGGNVPGEEIVIGVAAALGMKAEEVDEFEIKDFLPISTRFGELIKGITGPN